MAEINNKNSKNVFYVGCLAFFGGISQDMLVPILPLYLANVLGLSKEFIGLTEGVAKAGASIFKVVSGYWSDKFHQNKPIVFVGYFLSMISRPLLVVVSGAGAIFGLRALDGVGKGVKDSAKDVLLAGSTNLENRGRDFGVARMLDTLGSVVGPVALFSLLYLLQNNELKYRYILLLCALPLAVTLGILVFQVKEVEEVTAPKIFSNTLGSKGIGSLPKSFWWFLGIMVVFNIGNSSDAFLILRAQNVGVGILMVPLVYALFNLVYAFAAVPLGGLSDKIGRAQVILLGFLAYAIVYIGFGLARNIGTIWAFFAFYGLYYATTEGVAKAFIADLVESDHRGRAYGVYNAAVGVVALPASFMAGLLWDKFSPAAPFWFGGSVALISVGLLLVYLEVYKVEKV